MENPLCNWQLPFEVSDTNSSDLSALLDTHPLMYLKEQEQDCTPLSSSLTGFCSVDPPAPKPNMSSTKDPILLYINDMLLAEKIDHLQDLTNNTSCASDLSWKELELEDSLWPMEDLLKAPLQFDEDKLDDGMDMESLLKGPLPQLCDESLSCSKVEVEGWINEALHEVDAQCEAHVSSLVCSSSPAASSPLPEVNSPQLLALWHYNESTPEAALGCDEEGDDSAQLASVWHDSDVENMGSALQGKVSHLEVDLQDNDDQLQQYFAGSDALHTDPCRASLDNQSPRGLCSNQSDVITDVEVQHVHVEEKVEGVTACNGGVKVGAEIEVAAASGKKNGGPRRRKTTSDKRRRQNSSHVRMWRGVAPTMVDLRGLLVRCAEAVASNNAHEANENLREIWRHASPLGNGTQRLAHYFAQGLAARLSGTGGLLQDLRRQQGALTVSSNNKDDSVLRAYHTYVAVCPFLKLSHFFANEATLSISRDADCLHIVDFNILYGFQWPCFLKALAERAGGPPALRLTGVDVIRPGKPGNASTRERLSETGRRLEEYALAYGIPFKYRGVTLVWEGVSTDSLRLREGETLVVNCIYRLRHLMDDTAGRTVGSAASGASPREAVLARIRRLNPALFVEGVVNARYNAPFFMSRFKEAMFHYSSMFDALDATIRKDLEERLVIERDIMGPEILNVVACEGVERLERPETCREWQLRTQSVGFEVLPVDPIIKGKAQAIARGFYHKDYGVEDDEHGRWLLLGWKGRMLHGISSWRPSPPPRPSISICS